MWADQARRDAPWQAHAKRLLSVGEQQLPGAEAIQMARQPDMERAHVQTDGHISAYHLLKLIYQPSGVNRYTIRCGGRCGEHLALTHNFFQPRGVPANGSRL